MAQRDEHGRFISEEEAAEDAEEEAVEEQPIRRWSEEEQPTAPIYVDVGRGQAVEVSPGAPFVSTLTRLADEAHYGGYYRIFLNGSEVVSPGDAPATIEPSMRIAITSYDKVGLL